MASEVHGPFDFFKATSHAFGETIDEDSGALNCALSAPNALEQWISGHDPLTRARISDFNPIEAGAIFDAVDAWSEGV